MIARVVRIERERLFGQGQGAVHLHEQGQKAGIFKGMGLAHRFRDEASKAASLDPKYVDARESLMEFYFEAPGIAGGDKKKAWALADEIGKIDAARGFLARANLAGKEKNPVRQNEFYEKALATAPHDARVLREAAHFYVSDTWRKPDLAEKYALEALKLDEERIGPYVALAVVYASAGRWSDLDATLARSEKNVPDDFGTYYQAGKSLLVSGKDLPRAERYFRKYLTMEPEVGEPPWAGRTGGWDRCSKKKATSLGQSPKSRRRCDCNPI